MIVSAFYSLLSLFSINANKEEKGKLRERRNGRRTIKDSREIRRNRLLCSLIKKISPTSTTKPIVDSIITSYLCKQLENFKFQD